MHETDGTDGGSGAALQGIRGATRAGRTADGLVPVAAVSYLNTLPLIEGVAKLDRVRLHLTAPADLIGLLEDGTVDVALASSIDYQRSTEELGLFPCGVIASDGPTFTVRVFSREPIESVRTVHADVESHTSVTLLRVLMKRLHGVDVEIQPFTAPAAGAGGAESDWPPAVLLIGDKVVSGAPPAAVYPHQLDLGDAWHGLTGLPFVYATWMVRLADAESNPALLAHAGTLLDRQRRHNATRLSWIAATHAARHGWPVETAVKYLTEYLSYGLTERHAAGLERFFEMAGEQGLIDTVRPVRWVAAESLTW